MYRARKKSQVHACNGVKSLRDLAKFLKNSANVLKYAYTGPTGQNMEINMTHAIVEVNENIHIILKNDKLLKDLVKGTTVHMDGTFACRPNFADCAQLLTVLVRRYNQVIF